jgi:hypothetical protein
MSDHSDRTKELMAENGFSWNRAWRQAESELGPAPKQGGRSTVESGVVEDEALGPWRPLLWVGVVIAVGFGSVGWLTRATFSCRAPALFGLAIFIGVIGGLVGGIAVMNKSSDKLERSIATVVVVILSVAAMFLLPITLFWLLLSDGVFGSDC